MTSSQTQDATLCALFEQPHWQRAHNVFHFLRHQGVETSQAYGIVTCLREEIRNATETSVLLIQDGRFFNLGKTWLDIKDLTKEIPAKVVPQPPHFAALLYLCRP